MRSGGSVADEVLSYFRAHPGVPLRANEIAEQMGRSANSVSRAVNALGADEPALANPTRGVWIYDIESIYSAADESRPRRGWTRRIEVERYLRQHEGEAVTVKEIARALGTPESVVNRAISSLRRRLPGLEKHGPVKFVYNPPSAEDADARDTDGPAAIPTKADRKGGHRQGLPQHLEVLTVHSSHALVLQDENRDLWIARPLEPEPLGPPSAS